MLLLAAVAATGSPTRAQRTKARALRSAPARIGESSNTAIVMGAWLPRANERHNGAGTHPAPTPGAQKWAESCLLWGGPSPSVKTPVLHVRQRRITLLHRRIGRDRAGPQPGRQFARLVLQTARLQGRLIAGGLDPRLRRLRRSRLAGYRRRDDILLLAQIERAPDRERHRPDDRRPG